MDLKIIGTKTGRVVYQCVTTGDSYEPSSIIESGDDCESFKKMIDDVFNNEDDIGKHLALTFAGTGAHLIASNAETLVYRINEEAGEKLYEIKIVDLPKHVPKIKSIRMNIDKFLAE